MRWLFIFALMLTPHALGCGGATPAEQADEATMSYAEARQLETAERARMEAIQRDIDELNEYFRGQMELLSQAGQLSTTPEEIAEHKARDKKVRDGFLEHSAELEERMQEQVARVGRAEKAAREAEAREQGR